MLTPPHYHSTKAAKAVQIITPQTKQERKTVASISKRAPCGTLLQ